MQVHKWEKITNITKSLTTKFSFFFPQLQHIISCINSHGKALKSAVIQKKKKKKVIPISALP